MGDQIDPKLAKQVAKTQELLSPFVKKSLLVEKHLARPPFRQIHDIVININDSTGFFKGLFSPDELDSNNIKTKEAKVAFLQKIVDVLGIATGQTMTLKPSKVLSGQEVEKTNDFLQSLGKALKDGVKSTEAVKTVTGKGAKGSEVSKPATTSKPKPGETSKKPAAAGGDAKSRSRSKEPSPARKPVAPAAAATKAPDKTSTTKKDASSKPTATVAKPVTKPAPAKAKGSTERLAATKPQPVKVMPPAQTQPKENTSKAKAGKAEPAKTGGGSGQNSRRNSLTNLQQADSKARTATEGGNKNGTATDLPVGPTERRNSVDQNARGATPRGRQPQPSSTGRSGPVTPTDRSSAVSRNRPASGVGSARARITNGSGITEESPAEGFFTRPASARPGAPRPKTATMNYRVEDTASFRPPTSKVAVLVDTGGGKADGEDDDADAFIVQEKAPDTTSAPTFGGIGSTPFGGVTENDGINIEELPPEQRGLLVNQMLEAKKEFEESRPGRVPDSEMSEKERSKLHQNWEAELDKLKGLLQTIARTSNPLGKLMDYVQEDIDTMLGELNHHQEENRRLDEVYEKEQIKMKEELEPLRKELDEVDNEIKDAEDALIGTKLHILRQEEKINKILLGLESAKGGFGTLDMAKFKSIKVYGHDVDVNSSSPFRNDAVPNFDQIISKTTVNQQPSYLQVPAPDLNSLVLEEEYI